MLYIMEKTKMLYASPECEVLELRMQGIIASSPAVEFGDSFTFDGEEM